MLNKIIFLRDILLITAVISIYWMLLPVAVGVFMEHLFAEITTIPLAVRYGDLAAVISCFAIMKILKIEYLLEK